MKKNKERILDVYINDKLIVKIYNNPDDLTKYREMHLFVEEWGETIEFTNLKKDKKK